MAEYLVKIVQNADNIQLPARYRSWMDFWRKHVPEFTGECQATNCHEQAHEGCIVKVVKTQDAREAGETQYEEYPDIYVVPLCNPENHPTHDGYYRVEGPLVNIYVDEDEVIKLIQRISQLMNSTDPFLRRRPIYLQ
jgi:hypothetical protein